MNLSAHRLTATEKSQLKFGLKYSFIDKNKNQRKFLAANLESVCQRVVGEIHPEVKDRIFMNFLEGIPIFLLTMLIMLKTILIRI